MVASMAAGMGASMVDVAAPGASKARTPLPRKTLEQPMHRWLSDGDALSSWKDFVEHSGQTRYVCNSEGGDASVPSERRDRPILASATSARTWLDGNHVPSQ